MLKERPITQSFAEIWHYFQGREGAARGKMSIAPLSLLFEYVFYIVIKRAFNFTFCFRNHFLKLVLQRYCSLKHFILYH